MMTAAQPRCRKSPHDVIPMNPFIRIILKSIGTCGILLGVLCFIVPLTSAEFYRYKDRDGRMVFVDDISKIPPEYLDQIRTYKEREDSLPEDQKAIFMERRRQAEDSRWQQAIEEEQARVEQRQRKTRQTDIVIDGNKVLVPVTLGYDGLEAEAMLVLDTGASIIALHREVADRLEIKDAKKAKFRVVGGSTIETDVVQLEYVKVGPHVKSDLHAGIIDHEGVAVSYNGLLGMNFLRGLEYSIDFDKQVIKWYQ